VLPLVILILLDLTKSNSIHQVRKYIDTTQYLLTALLTPAITYCTCILANKWEKNTSGR